MNVARHDPDPEGLARSGRLAARWWGEAGDARCVESHLARPSTRTAMSGRSRRTMDGLLTQSVKGNE